MMHQVSDTRERVRSIAELIRRLEGEGWMLGEDVVCLADGRLSWVVAGCRGPHLIRAEGASMAQAWAIAEQQARAPGTVGDLPRPAPPRLGGFVVSLDEGDDRGRAARQGDGPRPRYPHRGRSRLKTHRDERHSRRANPFRN